MLRIGDVTETVGLSKSKIYDMIAAGEFPPPVRIGARTARWLGSEIKTWAEGLRRT